MKYILTTATIFLLSISLTVSAQSETGSQIQELISSLRAQHQELKAQVTAGEITKEEAHAIWQELLEEARAQKEEYFAEKFAKAQARIDKIAEKRPELAEAIKTRIETVRANREQAQTKRLEIRTQLQNEEITKEEAMELRKEVRTSVMEQNQEVRSEFRDMRAKLIEERPVRERRAPTPTE